MNTHTNPVAYIFDVDGVLVDSPHERAWAAALHQLMASEWLDYAQMIGYEPSRFSGALYQQYVAGKPRHAGAAAALYALGINDHTGRMAQHYAEVKQSCLRELITNNEFARFHDAEHLLLRLKRAGVRLAVASSSQNANDFMERIFLPDGTRMDMIFDANVCGQAFAQGKPHPAIFLTAAAKLQVLPTACVVVEDAPAGVQAAKAGHFTCIAIARMQNEQQLRAAGADLVVTSLDML
jgi:beta-phosphoglucomutase-like phosphatase (HAD superfamily)